MSLWFLLVCHALTQNDAESPVDIFLSTSQKRSQKHMSTQKVFTSRHGLFVQISLSVWKLLKHFKHQNVIHDVSLRSISNSTFWMTFRTLLSLSSLRDKTNETSPINAKQSSFFRSQNEFYDLLTIPSCNSAIVHRRRKQRKAYGKWFDFPCHYTNSNPHDVLRAIKVVKEDEKYIVVGFRHLQ